MDRETTRNTVLATDVALPQSAACSALDDEITKTALLPQRALVMKNILLIAGLIGAGAGAQWCSNKVPIQIFAPTETTSVDLSKLQIPEPPADEGLNETLGWLASLTNESSAPIGNTIASNASTTVVKGESPAKAIAGELPKPTTRGPDLAELGIAEPVDVAGNPRDRSMFDNSGRKPFETSPRTADPKPAPAAPRSSQPLQEFGSSVSEESTSNPEPKPATTETTRKNDSSESPSWKSAGKSVDGRPIHTVRLGSGVTRVLVVAGTEGDDRIAVLWMDELLNELVKHPEWLSRGDFLMVRGLNPDGLTRFLRENSHGVLLDRNFPTKRFRPSPSDLTGPTPGSEPETKFAMELLYNFSPQVAIHLQSTTARSEVAYLGAISPAAELLRAKDWNTIRLETQRTQGSLLQFVSETFDASTLRLRANVGRDWSNAWGQHRQQILAVVVPPSVPSAAGARTESTPIRSTLDAPQRTRQIRRKGFQELPPAPW